MGDWRTQAARNNAEWCDVVCRFHGAQTHVDDEAWTSPTRTPPYYPDAVTLVPEPSVPDLLRRVDASAGCSIKDSFAALDLSRYGFRVLFDAEWIVRPSTPLVPEAGDGGWEMLHDPDDLARWVEAWRGSEGPTDVLLPALLGHDAVSVLAARVGGRVVAGALLNRSATVVGISNFFGIADFFADARAAAAGWSGCLALAVSLFPTATFVGYESDEGLAAAQRHGFEVAGPLRVWITDAQGG